MSIVNDCRDLILLGKLAEAERKLGTLINAGSENPDVVKLLGIIQFKTGRGSLALDSLTFFLAHHPDDLEALTWLAAALQSQGQHQEAIDVLNRILAIKQDDAEVYNLLGICLLGTGKPVEAEVALRESLRLGASSAPTFANLGMALRLQNRGNEALEAFRKAVQLAPGQVQNHLQLFKQLQQLSRIEEAIASLKVGRKLHPQSVILAEAMALALGRVKQGEEAEYIFRQIAPISTSAANSYAAWLQEEGRFEDAVPVLQESLRLQPLQGSPYRSLVELKTFTLEGISIREQALALAKDPRLDDSARMHLAYALGKVYDHEGDYQSAMGWFDLANTLAYQIYPASKTFDPDWTRREPELMAEIYSPEFLDSMKPLGSADDRPIFIVGMIRSGTTLLDQIISSHPAVTSVGEGTFWNSEGDAIHPKWAKEWPNSKELHELAARYIEAVGVHGDAKNFTDKMPLNYRHLGLILSVFPNARVVHIRRDPLDTCLSIYTTFFAGGPNFAYSQSNIVAFYRSYMHHMEHWRKSLQAHTFFELDYESLVAKPERVSREVIEFLGLRWHDACLQPERNREQVSTPSRWQARQPIYKSSVERWKRYEPWLGALLDLKGIAHPPIESPRL